MAGRTLRIATRKSPLALWQAEFVKSQLLHFHPQLTIELVGFTTKGDKILDVPLAKVGGKGLFVKELETAMLAGDADIAVHSMKDVPMEFPEGLGLAVICEREDPTDAFVSHLYSHPDQLPADAVVGTSSLRRQSQLRAKYPHLRIEHLRGNVQTRLRKLDEGQYQAIILATAGLVRLQLEERIRWRMPAEFSLPAGGQGAVGIECRSDDQELINLLQPLHHRDTAICVSAERAMNRRLQGGCQVPIACFAQLLAPEKISIRGLVASVDGETQLYESCEGHADDAELLGVQMAEALLQRGADAILRAVYDQQDL